MEQFVAVRARVRSLGDPTEAVEVELSLEGGKLLIFLMWLDE